MPFPPVQGLAFQQDFLPLESPFAFSLFPFSGLPRFPESVFPFSESFPFPDLFFPFAFSFLALS